MRGRRFLSRFAADARGVAAIELALVGTLVMGALLNVVEVGRYAYITAQVNAASQAGAHAAIVTCTTTKVPVTVACEAAPDKIEAAIAGTSLGEAVTLDGALHEGWYCVNSQGALQHMAPATDVRPQNCGGAGAASGKAALYLRVRTAYNFEPVFPGLTITETFPDRIVRTAWMRML